MARYLRSGLVATIVLSACVFSEGLDEEEKDNASAYIAPLPSPEHPGSNFRFNDLSQESTDQVDQATYESSATVEGEIMEVSSLGYLDHIQDEEFFRELDESGFFGKLSILNPSASSESGLFSPSSEDIADNSTPDVYTFSADAAVKHNLRYGNSLRTASDTDEEIFPKEEVNRRSPKSKKSDLGLRIADKAISKKATKAAKHGKPSAKRVDLVAGIPASVASALHKSDYQSLERELVKIGSLAPTNPAIGKLGQQLLRGAIQLGDSRALRIILDHGAQPGYWGRGAPVLFYAISLEDVEATRILLEKGANVNFVRHGTPIYRASAKENEEIVKLLLDAGADPGKASPQGRPPLHFAASHNLKGLAVRLFQLGARADERYNGRTALEIAEDNPEMKEIFRKFAK